VNSESVTNSLLPVAGQSERYVDPALTRPVGAVDVDVTTIDGFCADQGVAHVHVLKLDIQGGELPALRGAEGRLRAGAIDLVYAEVLFARLYDDQTEFVELYRYLGGLGYQLYGLYDLHHGRNQVLAWGDALFIGPHLREELDAIA
jgi:hypothetical protein